MIIFRCIGFSDVMRGTRIFIIMRDFFYEINHSRIHYCRVYYYSLYIIIFFLIIFFLIGKSNDINNKNILGIIIVILGIILILQLFEVFYLNNFFYNLDVLNAQIFNLKYKMSNISNNDLIFIKTLIIEFKSTMTMQINFNKLYETLLKIIILNKIKESLDSKNTENIKNQ